MSDKFLSTFLLTHPAYAQSSVPSVLGPALLGQNRLVPGGALSTGFRSSTGRPIGVQAEELLSGYVKLSDGGESWSELVAGGFAEPVPTASERDKLVRLCHMYGIDWDQDQRALSAVTIASKPEEIESAVRRITAASIAIDGWRAWYPPIEKPLPSALVMAHRIERVANKFGWSAEINAVIEGKIHSWPANVRLSGKRGSAAVAFSHERPEAALQQIIGFLYDVKDHGLVLVVPESTARAIGESTELPSRVKAVSRAAPGVVDLILKATEIAAAA